MRISDWSSDVCSSDLVEPRRRRPHILAQRDIPALPEAGAGLARSRIEREQPCVGGGRDDLLGAHPRRARRRRVIGDTAAREIRVRRRVVIGIEARSEEHTSELQSLMRISYAVFCLKKKKNI